MENNEQEKVIVKGKKVIILLIEDNPDHAELIKISLEENKVKNKIYHTIDGEDALDYLYRKNKYIDPDTSPTPDMILLDLRLPKIDGIEVLKTIKEDDANKHLRSIPVVVLTSSGAETDLISAYDHYVNSYLVKPLDFGEFQKMIEDLSFYWLVWNKQPQ